jgi:hypothetical protein
MKAIQESVEYSPSKVLGLLFFRMKDGGAEAEADAGEFAAWEFVNWAIRPRWAVNSEWISKMSAIICSSECGLVGSSKIGGEASNMLEILVEFVCFRVFFRRLFLAKTGFGVVNRP